MITSDQLDALRAEAQETASVRRMRLVLEQQMDLEQRESDRAGSLRSNPQPVSNKKTLSYELLNAKVASIPAESLIDDTSELTAAALAAN